MQYTFSLEEAALLQRIRVLREMLSEIDFAEVHCPLLDSQIGTVEILAEHIAGSAVKLKRLLAKNTLA